MRENHDRIENIPINLLKEGEGSICLLLEVTGYLFTFVGDSSILFGRSRLLLVKRLCGDFVIFVFNCGGLIYMIAVKDIYIYVRNKGLKGFVDSL